jgi:hypothetical protein
LALGLGWGVRASGLYLYEITLWGHTTPLPILFIGAFIAAHLVIVVCRSHLNGEVFQRYRLRFVVAPLVLLVAVYASTWAMALVALISVWWDVYHSGLQTFGLGRIYDLRQGNDLDLGRRLDWILNLLLYVGPILAGATLLTHLELSLTYTQLATHAFDHVPAFAGTHQRPLTWAVSLGGVAFLAYYVFAYARLARSGYRVSWQKVALLVSTGLCSIVAWGFNAFGEAFFIMNFFHALQYFGIIWWSEGERLTRRLRLSEAPGGRWLALFTFLWIAALYGLVTKVFGPANRLITSLALVVSIMHFWYDGFVWSVRKKMIP